MPSLIQALSSDKAERTSHGDFAEQAAANGQIDLQIGLVSIISEEEREVRLAKRRKAEGKAGICSDCEQEIAEDRLKAKPHATRCKTCQERHEAQRGIPLGFVGARR